MNALGLLIVLLCVACGMFCGAALFGSRGVIVGYVASAIAVFLAVVRYQAYCKRRDAGRVDEPSLNDENS